jgi:hypothetical protein
MDVLLRNRHPADELADVRAEIKRLQLREAELRNILLAEGADRTGIQYKAVVLDTGQKHINTKALIDHFGAATMRPFFRSIACRVVKLEGQKSSGN